MLKMGLPTTFTTKIQTQHFRMEIDRKILRNLPIIVFAPIWRNHIFTERLIVSEYIFSKKQKRLRQASHTKNTSFLQKKRQASHAKNMFSQILKHAVGRVLYNMRLDAHPYYKNFPVMVNLKVFQHPVQL